MSETIKSGKSGYVATVDEFEDLHTFSTQRTEAAKNTVDGNTFWLASGFVPLTTTGSFSGIFYVKNTHDTENLNIDFLRTCNFSPSQWQLYRNSTTGTLISGGTAITPGNANFGINTPLSSTVLGGADGDTITDGAIVAQWINGAGHSVQNFQGTIVLAPGNSLSLNCKPTVATTACVTAMAWQSENR